MKKYTIKKKVFKKNDFTSSDGMLTPVWGPSLWHFLHTISFNYPVNPTKENKKQYKDFMMNLQFILPCVYCRENLTKNYKAIPITQSVMKSRESFSRYVYELHERINKLLGKKSGLTYCDVRERYEHFRARCITDASKNKDIGLLLKDTEKNKTRKRKEKGCTDPLYGTKSKCIIKIVPLETKEETLQIDEKCYKTKLINKDK